MKFQTNYEVVPVERELPENNAICFRGEKHSYFKWAGNDLNDLNMTHWLREVPESRVVTKDDLIKIISEAWDAGVERFCFDNGSEFVEGIPATKQTYINSIVNK